MTDLNNATVLITGAGGGFGREMIRQFAAEGSKLVLHDMPGVDLTATAEELLADTSVVRVVSNTDLSNTAGADELFEAVNAAGIVPDIIVNNAGIGYGGRLDYVPEDRWDAVMQINLMSPMRICQLFMPGMIERGSGHVVNISSIAGWVGPKSMTSYAASKFGLRGFSQALRGDLSPHGIKVSTVYPWFSRTPILESESFGPKQNLEVPEDQVTEPADVIGEVVRGVKNNVDDIFPDKMARRIQFISRHFPRMLNRMIRRLNEQVFD